MSDTNTETVRKPLANVKLTITEAPVLKTNVHGKTYLLAKGTSQKGRKITVMTYVQKAIEALKDQVVGAVVPLYGTWDQRSFSAMGLTKPKPAAIEAPAEAAPAPVAS